jgi:uncharacterized membrane protein YfcA
VSFSASTAVLLVVLGFGVGTFGTLVGAGGGFILTPVLLVLYPHDSPQTISAISIAVVFFNAASGSVAYARQRRTDYRSGLIFGAATLPGAVVGAIAVTHVSRRFFDAVMVAVLLGIAAWLLGGDRLRREPRPGPEGVRRVPLVKGAVLSLIVGFVSSFLGIGGGIIHVPLMIQALGFPVHIATATSHFVLAIMSGAATVTHLVQGSYSVGHGLRRTLALSAGVIVGAQLGARVSTRVSGKTIQRLLVAAILVLSVRLLVMLG